MSQCLKICEGTFARKWPTALSKPYELFFLEITALQSTIGSDKTTLISLESLAPSYTAQGASFYIEIIDIASN